MIILGIHDGHNCGVSIFEDGKLLLALNEERITRNKNEYGFPLQSINYCLKYFNLKKKDINFIAVSTRNLPPKYFAVKRNTSFSIEDYKKEQDSYWYQKIYKKKKVKYLKLFSKKKVSKKKLFYDLRYVKNEDDVVGMRNARLNGISNFFNLSKKKIFFFDHHQCHAYYGYYSSDFYQKKSIIVTSDGGGDGSNGSIWLAEKNKIKELYRTNICNIGRMYRYATLNLNMKPTEHEFKVMGLAGYALKNNAFFGKLENFYSKTLDVKNAKFFYKLKPKDNYFYFKNLSKNIRFDTLAYFIQNFTENILEKWFLQIYDKYKIKNFIFSGGVAQNIKATKKISTNKKINKLFVPPGPGDESLMIGVVYCLLNKFGVDKKKISTLINPYKGCSFKKESLNFLKNKNKIILKKVKPKDVALILNSGEVVARFSLNNFEFGPRALGNRSIIADPRSIDTIHYINKSVKVRDFWMPFAPSVLEEDFEKYFISNKKNNFNFMTGSLDTTNFGKKLLGGGIHPFDKTARPQKVKKKINKEYYELIKEFKKISGVGALLNTSFNIHGEPIVFSPKDAFKSFMSSGLKYLYIGDYLIKKI